MFLEATCFQRVAGTCVGKESDKEDGRQGKVKRPWQPAGQEVINDPIILSC